MTKKLFGLGKGLGSLIPSPAAGSPASKENVFYVEVAKVRPNPDQPRRDFDQSALKDLAASIRKYGVLQPLLVSKMEEATGRGLNVFYQLIAGERRLRAAQLAGLPQVPVVIRDEIPVGESSAQGASQRLEMALIENLQREDLNPMEEAHAYARLMNEFGLTQNQIAEQVSKSRPVIANTIRFLKLPAYIQDAVRGGKISATHARALVSFEDPVRQKSVYEQILAGAYTARDTEESASESKSPTGRKSSDGRFSELQKNLGEKLSVPVLIKAGANGGHIMIRFSNLEQLNGVVRRIID